MNARSTARKRILDAVDRFRRSPETPDASAAAFAPTAADNVLPSQTIRRLIVHSIDHMETVHDLTHAEAQQTVRKRISMPTMRISMEFAAGLL